MSGSEHAEGASSIPVFLQKWQAVLMHESSAFRLLREEQRSGWESPALDWYYKREQERNSTSGGAPPASTTTPAATTCTTTSFSAYHVDIEALAERYSQHASKILQRAAPAMFSLHANNKNNNNNNQLSAASSPSSSTFVDFGCAPGGVSTFLCRELLWRGVGVSLPVEQGGIPMTSRLSDAPQFVFLGKSILDDDVDVSVRMVFERRFPSAPLHPQFQFVNCGAVQDHGQRASEEGSTSLLVEPVLPWFHFLVPQLISALRLTAYGGSVMFVYGMPTCGSLMLLLHLLVVELQIVPSFDDIVFLETMHLTKPPVYVFLRRVDATPEKTKRLSKIFAEGECNAMSEQASEESVSQTLRRTATAYWTLEHDSEKQKALIALRACKASLEGIWTSSAQYLEQRRKKAEFHFSKHQQHAKFTNKRARD